MDKTIFRRGVLLAALAAAALSAGCASVATNTLSPWPPNPAASASTPPAASTEPVSAILFKLNIDAAMQGTYLRSLILRFPLLSEIEAKVDAGLWQSISIDGNAVNKFPNDVLLLPVRPGNYFAAGLGVFYRNPGGNLGNVAMPLNKEFAHFTVKPGEIVDLGAVDISMEARSVSDQMRQTSVTIAADSSLARKVEAVEAALARPEADSLHWRDALEALHGGVISAGEFGGQFELKPWPTRVPAAAGVPPHPATAVAFKFAVDESANAAYPIRSITLYFCRSDEPDTHYRTCQNAMLPANLVHRLPGNVLLLPLQPGAYAGTTMDIVYGAPNTGNREVTENLLKDFRSFKVETGKVTVLEDVDFKFHANAASMPDGRPAVQWHVDDNHAGSGVFDARETQTDKASAIAVEGRRRSIEAALSAPEADALRWRAALEAAKASLSR